MSEIKTIYLAGSVAKSDMEMVKIKDWRDEFILELNKISSSFEYINPGKIKFKDRVDSKEIFGACAIKVKEADLVIVYAPDKIGIGTAQEMLIAKYFNRPVIVVVPKNTYHRKANLAFDGVVAEDWIHPFVAESSDIVIESKIELKDAFEKLDNLKGSRLVKQ